MGRYRKGAGPAFGELFMVGVPGPTIDSDTYELVRDYGINNFILFKRNVVDPLRLFRLCRDLKDACLENGLVPPLISIDQEGGRVARLGAPFTQFISPSEMAGSPDPERAVKDFARVAAGELKLVGCNMNLVPVLDLAWPGADGVMEGRTLGNDPAIVGRLGSLMIQGLQERGIAATAKHFPGIGRVKSDPHYHLPVIEGSSLELEARDLLPFRAAISANVASVMTAHVIYPDLDKENPATLSSEIVTALLRHRLGFDGIVIADDMEMGAIEGHYTIEESAVRAFQAGVDLLLICHKKEKVVQAFDAIAGLVGEDDPGRRLLAESLERINRIKGIFTGGEQPGNAEETIKNYFKL
ncbi:MAG: beta-N-acetylhexosaminidase [Pseudomonadota bacterium]